MKLYNSLTKQKEDFLPIDEHNVRFYVCGPTVYDFAHIGNARPVVVFDVLYRLLTKLYPKVTYARNITDVDDKIIKRSFDENIEIEAVATRATDMYHQDMDALNALRPNYEPRATEHIADMIDMIEKLIAKGHAYEAEGHVLFNVNSYKPYGELARRPLEDMVAGSRVEVAPYKLNAHDFVLWKPSTDGWPGWDSPWGYGRPGWHIECSAMSKAYLGNVFDIHGGGIDLIFPHHENEVAQSCCANDTRVMANIWMHNGHLSVGGQKMSKSLGNFITVRDLLNKGEKGEVIRLAMLQTHYRQPFDWNDKTLQDARNIMYRLYQAIKEVAHDAITPKYCREFMAYLEDDLNTPSAIRYMQELAQGIFKSEDASEKSELAQKLTGCGELMGLLQHSAFEWFQGSRRDDDSKIEALIEQRKIAKSNRDFSTADHVRDELKAMGIELEDSKDGTTWRRTTVLS